MSNETVSAVKRCTGDTGPLNWDSLPVLAYKETGSTFRAITRQVIFDGDERLRCQWRYFEIAPGGYSTLERHGHLHLVMILRGSGRVLVGNEIHDVSAFDLVRIESMTWHQFRAGADEPLGFLCLVNIDRDRPQLPDDAALEQLRAIPAVAEFIRT